MAAAGMFVLFSDSQLYFRSGGFQQESSTTLLAWGHSVPLLGSIPQVFCQCFVLLVMLSMTETMKIIGKGHEKGLRIRMRCF